MFCCHYLVFTQKYKMQDNLMLRISMVRHCKRGDNASFNLHSFKIHLFDKVGHHGTVTTKNKCLFPVTKMQLNLLCCCCGHNYELTKVYNLHLSVQPLLLSWLMLLCLASFHFSFIHTISKWLFRWMADWRMKEKSERTTQKGLQCALCQRVQQRGEMCPDWWYRHRYAE